jgi:hypothetical protein
MKRFLVVLLVLALSTVLSQGGVMQHSMNPDSMRGPMRQGRGMMDQMMGQEMMASSLHHKLADLLGVTSDELFTLRQGGKTFTEVIEELGGNLETITSQLVQSRNENIDQALSSGTITQVQTERMKARSGMVVTAMLNRNIGVEFSKMNVVGMMPCPHHAQRMFSR